MPGLLIKDLPKHVHRKLKERARQNRRSLTKEALTILETALVEDAGGLSLSELDRHRIRGRKPLTDRLIRRAKSEGRP